MRSKGEGTMEKAKRAQGATPRLRFSGFEGSWCSKQLGGEGEFLSSLTGKKGVDFGAGNAKFVTYMNVFSNTFVDATNLGSVKVDPKESQNLVQKGDVLFTVSSETLEEAGMSSVILEDIPNCYVNSFCAVFRFDNTKAPHRVFAGYLFRQPATRAYFSAKAQGSTRFNLSKEAFRNLPLFVPEEEEQRKIADCLSSLDACIGAGTRKLNALKAHKQGLMQQLFPAEGERMPRLRFPGFEEEWDEHPVSEMLEEVLRPIKMDDENDYMLVTVKRRYGGIVLRGIFKGRTILVKSQFGVKKDDLLISKRQIVHCACGVVPEKYDGATVSNEYSIFQARENCEIGFFNYFSQQPVVSRSFLECSVGIVIEKMLFKQDQWLKARFLFPSLQEQQKVAVCLSSLDELIAAQHRKISVLRQHKKGLMQGLFPAADADAA